MFFVFVLFLAASHGMWDLSSRPGTEPVPPAVDAWSLNHWTAKEVPFFVCEDGSFKVILGYLQILLLSNEEEL